MKLTGAQILVKALKAEGITHIFGVSASDMLPILDLLYHEPQMRYIQTQHEQGAIYMANGFARAKRTAGICLVSPGPGITNCLSGMSQAYFTSTPSLLIAVEESTHFYGRGSSLHHDLEAVPIFKPLTKLALRVERVDRLLESLQMAFRSALAGRKRPVYLGIPKDVLAEEVEIEVLEPTRYRVEYSPPADSRSIVKAADLLVAGERPVALVGGGLAWSQAQDVLLELAELLAMPVASTRHNKGLIPEDHPLALGTAGITSSPMGRRILRESDVVLAVGCTFDEFTTMSFGHQVIPQRVRIIQVDIDPMEIGKIYPVELGIVGDARSVLLDLLQEIKERKVDRRPLEQRSRIKELLRMKRERQETLLCHEDWNKVPIRWPRLLHDLRQALVRDAIVAGASGGTCQWFDYAFEALAYNFAIGGWHPMGSEYPEALGVKLAIPDRVVVCLIGDGSMMMTLSEMATASAHGIPLLCVVSHNGVFGNMRYAQIKRFGGRFIGTDLPIPNLANIAQEFGAHGERVEKPDEIIPAVGRGLRSGKPALIEVMMDNSPENLVPPSGS